MSNFGPIDTSVLYGQLNHRTEDVSENPDTTLSVRRGDIAFFRVLQLAPRHIRVLQVLQNMGFLGVLQCGHVEIDTHLITALVERWRPETHTFHFSVGEATITLQDIAILWALPVEGNLITGIDTRCSTARICAMCILGGVLCPDATGNTVSLLYLRHMENIHEQYVSNWGSAVLAYLYRELCTASQRGKNNIGGAMQLLQIWAWSRIITLAPIE
ncbi:serine/threonine-protein phosphatase 7 long form homolog [Sesamum indicum]|uniref:Serine/threonine-protein phosphatase 7 long form homolog n=1 Tax=Sesamum indicum TaxID=4182 RepID=A0A6I9TIE4_SESIN|nr:serine/threonine-protein phosphatase 7 long form homolog [Sesamum indicum]